MYQIIYNGKVMAAGDKRSLQVRLLEMNYYPEGSGETARFVHMFTGREVTLVKGKV